MSALTTPPVAARRVCVHACLFVFCSAPPLQPADSGASAEQHSARHGQQCAANPAVDCSLQDTAWLVAWQGSRLVVMRCCSASVE